MAHKRQLLAADPRTAELGSHRDKGQKDDGQGKIRPDTSVEAIRPLINLFYTYVIDEIQLRLMWRPRASAVRYAAAAGLVKETGSVVRIHRIHSYLRPYSIGVGFGCEMFHGHDTEHRSTFVGRR